MSLIENTTYADRREEQVTALDVPYFWRKTKPFREVSKRDFMSHKWQVKNTLYGLQSIELFLRKVTRPEIVEQVLLGLRYAPMEVRLTPYILSRINW
ncbi:MAG: hypothetical protein VKL39_23200, partial [Leptolyngbyaceae bacterium]|nr:hypothetical protein [Leptolyngbyaceae bacterium]